MGLFDKYLGSTTIYRKGTPSITITKVREFGRIVKKFSFLVNHPESDDVLILHGYIEDGQPVIESVTDLTDSEFERLENRIYNLVLEEWPTEYGEYCNFENAVLMDKIYGI